MIKLRLFSLFFLITCLAASPGKSADPLDDIGVKNFRATIAEKLRETCRTPKAEDKQHWIPKGLKRDKDRVIYFDANAKPSETLRKLLNPPKTKGCDKWILDESSLDAVQKHLFSLRILGNQLYDHWVKTTGATFIQSINSIGLVLDENGYVLPEAARLKIVDSFLNETPLQDLPQLLFTILHHTAKYPANMDDFKIPSGLIQKTVPIAENGDIQKTFFKRDADPARVLKNMLTLQAEGEKWKIDCALAGSVVLNLLYLKQLDDTHSHIGTYNHTVSLIEGRNLAEVVWQLSEVKKKSIIEAPEKGTFGYIGNHWKYHEIFQGMPDIFYNGINIVACGSNQEGKPTFMGFEPEFKDGPLTKDEIYKFLIFHTCHDPLEKDLKSLSTRVGLQKEIKNLWERQQPELIDALDTYQKISEEYRQSFSYKIPPHIAKDLHRQWEVQQKASIH